MALAFSNLLETMLTCRHLTYQVYRASSVLFKASPACQSPARRQSSSQSGSGGVSGGAGRPRLGQTSVFYQTGLKISELPLVVQKVNDVLNIAPDDSTKITPSKERQGPTAVDGDGTAAGEKELENQRRIRENFLQSFEESFDNQETKEIIAGLRRCFTVSGIFRLLETIPAEEVTPSVAVEALKLIITLESSANGGNGSRTAPPPSYRQSLHGVRRISDAFGDNGQLSGSETFLRHAFINMLLDIVYRSRNPKVLIDCLEIVCNATFKASTPSSSSKRNDDANFDGTDGAAKITTSTSSSIPVTTSESTLTLLTEFKEKMLEEVLVLVTEGHLNLVQICDVIAIISKYSGNKKSSQELADKMWSGLVDKAANELNAESMVHVINAAPHLKASRSVILGLVCNRIGDFWQDYKTKDILEMLRVITSTRLTIGGEFTRKVMPVICSWLKTHIHTLSEVQLLAVVCCFSKMSYSNKDFNATLNKYIKVRGCYIQDANLVAAICDYCVDTRLRSEEILNGVSQYFVSHNQKLTTPQLNSIARVFGELDFHPSANGFEFWEHLERALMLKFSEFPPKDMIQLLLTFVYIERYPLNFVRKIFNPYFLDRLHNAPQDDIFASRAYLTLFDAAMKLECSLYGGPFLPKNYMHYMASAPLRSKSLASFLLVPLGEVIGDVNRIELYVKLPQLPLTVDMMIYPSRAASFLKFGFSQENSRCVAVLIHTTEHYDQSGQHLTGLQAMRVRNLKTLGFKVMQLKHKTVSRLRQDPTNLGKVLLESYEKAT